MYTIDTVLTEFTSRKIDFYSRKTCKNIAIVGEEDRYYRKSRLFYRLVQQGFQKKEITVFTVRNKFTLETENVSVIFGVRPCGVEGTVLEYATKNPHVKFAIIPCTCYGYGSKIVHYIRKYPCITGIETYKQGGFDTAWMILHNFWR